MTQQSLESLESRRLMAVTASAFHNTLYVWGDAGNNGISVEKSGLNLVVKQYVSGSGYVPLFTADPSYNVSQVLVMGYAGADTISIADAVTQTTTVYGGPGADWIKGGGGTNYLWGHGNWAADPSGAHDPATDDAAADTLIGGKGYNVMLGQRGNDTMMSSMTTETTPSANDEMYGGSGNDVFITNGTGTAYCNGQAGADEFRPGQNQLAYLSGGADSDVVNYAIFGTGVYAKRDGVTPSGARSGARNQRILGDVEMVVGTPYADYFSGTDTTDIFRGGGGADQMWGNGGNDALLGDDGDDVIHGGDGNDSIYGNNGNDAIYAEGGDDQVWAGAGNDWLFGSDGNDSLYGEDGNDWIQGDAGNDRMVGGTGADTIYAVDSNALDSVYGDNFDGTGAGPGDVAYVDHLWIFSDATHGVESVF